MSQNPTIRNHPKRVGISQRSLDEVKGPILIDKDVKDTGNSPQEVLRGGLVLVDDGTGKHIRADDAAAPAGKSAKVTSSEDPDTNWQNETVTCVVDGGEAIAVVLGGAVADAADVAADLNADEKFNGELYAVDNSGTLEIYTIEGGEDKHLKVTSTRDEAFGADGKEAFGDLPDHCVLFNPVDLRNANGVLEDTYGTALQYRGEIWQDEMATEGMGLTNLARLDLKNKQFIIRDRP